MANVKALCGFNDAQQTITSTLFAAHGFDVQANGSGAGSTTYGRLGLNISSAKPEMVAFLNSIFLTAYDGSNTFLPRTYDPVSQGTLWGKRHVRKTPCGMYLYPYKERMYMFNTKLAVDGALSSIYDVKFPSRVFYSDLPKAGELQWGFDWGRTNVEYGTNRLLARNTRDTGFKTYGIKVGDPIFLYPENDPVGYQLTVKIVKSNKEIETLEPIPETLENAFFWIGSNWFDVRTDDGDFGTWIGENNDRILFFKRYSLWRRGGPGTSLQRVKGSPGTTSGRSVVNVGKELTIFFHGGNDEDTGFYLYNGVESVKISNGVQPFIDGIASSFYDDVVGWKEGPVYRAYIGDLSNGNSSNKAFNISMSKAVFTWDSVTGATSIDPIGHIITCAGYLEESGNLKTLLGTSDDKVIETPSGNSFASLQIPWYVEMHPIYPRGAGVFNDFTRIVVIGRDLSGVKVTYKLWNTPLNVDQDYRPLGDLKTDLTELMIPAEHWYGGGIQLKFLETSTRENTPIIEKVIIYSVDRGDQVVDRGR